MSCAECGAGRMFAALRERKMRRCPNVWNELWSLFCGEGEDPDVRSDTLHLQEIEGTREAIRRGNDHRRPGVGFHPRRRALAELWAVLL